MTKKSPTCQPPSRIKTWDRNICSDGRSNPTKCGWRHHLLYISGFGDLADARVIIIIIEGHIHTGLCLASHAGPYNVAMSRPNANGRIPSFYSGGLAATRRTVEVKRHKSRTAGGDAGLSVHVERTKSTTSQR